MADLHPADTLVLACPNGHRFDVNRRGYVSLIQGSRRLIGDSPAMLDARDTFLEHGWYSDLRDALSTLVAQEPAGRVIDMGCGTGYYLRAVLAALAEQPTPQGDIAGRTGQHDAAGLSALAVDLSAPAVARSVRAALPVGGGTAGLVADVWSPLPIRDAVADVVINVFAPRNPVEFHRIVAPGGRLVVVIPHSSHLQELRADGLALDVHDNKRADLLTSLSGFFELERATELTRQLSLSLADVGALLGMGPSAHHSARAGAAGAGDTEPADRPASARPVTVAFQLLAFRRLPV